MITPICKDKYPLVLCLDCYGHFLIMEGNLSLIFINLNNFIPIHPLILILIENVFSLNTVQSSNPDALKLIRNKVLYLAYLRRCIENSMENMECGILENSLANFCCIFSLDRGIMLLLCYNILLLLQF